MRFLNIIMLTVFMVYSEYSYSQNIISNDTLIVKYHHCEITKSRSSFKFDFGEKTEYYGAILNTEKLSESASIIDILNKMSEYGWELFTVFVETSYPIRHSETFVRTRDHQKWVLRKRL